MATSKKTAAYKHKHVHFLVNGD